MSHKSSRKIDFLAKSDFSKKNVEFWFNLWEEKGDLPFDKIKELILGEKISTICLHHLVFARYGGITKYFGQYQEKKYDDLYIIGFKKNKNNLEELTFLFEDRDVSVFNTEDMNIIIQQIVASPRSSSKFEKFIDRIDEFNYGRLVNICVKENYVTDLFWSSYWSNFPHGIKDNFKNLVAGSRMHYLSFYFMFVSRYVEKFNKIIRDKFNINSLIHFDILDVKFDKKTNKETISFQYHDAEQQKDVKDSIIGTPKWTRGL